jgi:hypothetical protein
MRIYGSIPRSSLVCAILIASVAGAADAPLKGRTMYPEAQKPNAPKAVAATTIGTPDSVHWSATTWEAATAEAHKKMLESGKAKKVTGEIVDVSCYLQLGKRGPAHVECGTKCIKNGQPIGIVDDDGKLYILFAEEHHPRRDGRTDLQTVFLPLLAKTVTVNAMETEAGGFHALFVRAADIGAMKAEAAETK